MFKTEFRNTIEYPWTKMSPIYIGEVPKTLGTPEIYCIVEKDNSPYLLINLYSEYATHFREAIIWGNYIAIGFAESFYLIDIDNQNYIKTSISGYFGYLYPYENFLLVATESNILCFSKYGSQLWTSEILGIDGVVVNNFDGERIYGSGEYDPPGGWVDFVINSRTGKRVLN